MKQITQHDPKISVCIPTYEANGFGVFFLNKNLQSCLMQTYKNIEIVISDHSKNDDIYNFIKSFSKDVKLTYIRNTENYGNSPFNTNNAIKHSEGEIIKIMFQDDFFFNNLSLDLISKKFKDENCNWVVSSSNHTIDDGNTFFNTLVPRWNDDIPLGVNTISSPSVLTFRKKCELFFDDKLEMLMDCEMYYSLYLKYGLPVIINEVLVTNRLHKNQISSNYNKNIHDEISYIKLKHNIK